MESFKKLLHETIADYEIRCQVADEMFENKEMPQELYEKYKGEYLALMLAELKELAK